MLSTGNLHDTVECCCATSSCLARNSKAADAPTSLHRISGGLCKQKQYEETKSSSPHGMSIMRIMSHENNSKKNHQEQ
jgi:hypothetical protein